jgi:phenylpyruvate tautomerase PptA (4-oxalocrotonate tautomerase family)
MPLVRIDLDESREPRQREAISSGIHEAMITAFSVPAGDRFQIITPHPSAELVFDPAFLGVERTSVIFIQVILVQRQTKEAKLAFYTDVAARLATAGVRKEDLFIALVENQPEDWTAGQR